MPSDQTAYIQTKFDGVKVFSTIQSVSVGTGSFICDGGGSFAGNLYVGGSIVGGSVSYGTTNSGTFNVTDTTGTTLDIASTEQSTAVGTGAMVCDGGGSFAGNLYVGGTLVAGSVTYATTSSGTFAVTNGSGTTLTVSSNADSNSTSTGSVVLQGGMGIPLRLSVGSIRIFDTTQSTSESTGSLIIGGGFGAGGNAFIGGQTQSQKFISTNGDDATALLTGAIYTPGGISCSKQLRVGTTVTCADAAIGNTLVANSVDVSTTLFGNDVRCQGRVFRLGNNESPTTGTGRAFYKETDGALHINYGVDFTKTVVNGSLETTSSVVTQTLNNKGFDFILGDGDQITRGNSGPSRALVKDGGATLVINFGGDFGGGIRFDSNTVTQGSSNTQSLNVTGTTQSTSTTTGSGIFGGGVGIAKRLNVGGRITCTTIGATNISGTTLFLSNTSSTSIESLGGIVVQSISGSSLIVNSCQVNGRSFLLGNGEVPFQSNYRALYKETDGVLHLNYSGDFTSTTIGSNTRVNGEMEVRSFDFKLGSGDQVSRGNSGTSRAMVKDFGNVLTLNFGGDYTGGVKISGSKTVTTALECSTFKIGNYSLTYATDTLTVTPFLYSDFTLPITIANHSKILIITNRCRYTKLGQLITIYYNITFRILGTNYLLHRPEIQLSGIPSSFTTFIQGNGMADTTGIDNNGFIPTNYPIANPQYFNDLIRWRSSDNSDFYIRTRGIPSENVDVTFSGNLHFFAVQV